MKENSPSAARLTVVVPATDRPSTLDRCLAAIRRADHPPEELIVIDDPPGSGPAAARNVGAARATGSVIVFVDSDVLVHGDAFTRIRTAFAATPRLAAMFGSYDDVPPAGGVVSTFRNLLHHWVHQTSAGRVSTFWAGLGAVRRDAFVAAGGFDSGRFPQPSVEDVELGLRLAEAGEIELDPGLQGTHLKRWSLRSMVTTDLLSRGKPWVTLMLAHRRLSLPLNVRGRHLVGTVASVGTLVLAAIGQLALAALMAAAFLAINARLYALLLRRGGVRTLLAGPALHVLHSLIALASAPAGLVAFGRGLGRHRPQRSIPPTPAASAERSLP